MDYYRIIPFCGDEKYIPITNNWWGKEGEKGMIRSRELYWDHPLKVSLQEGLNDDFTLLPCWVVGRLRRSKYKQKPKSLKGKSSDDVINVKPNLRFALIRLRIQRVCAISRVVPLYLVTARSMKI